jgi:hypothetical protein
MFPFAIVIFHEDDDDDDDDDDDEDGIIARINIIINFFSNSRRHVSRFSWSHGNIIIIIIDKTKSPFFFPSLVSSKWSSRLQLLLLLLLLRVEYNEN